MGWLAAVVVAFMLIVIWGAFFMIAQGVGLMVR